MSYPPREGDRPSKELIPEMDELIRQGHSVYVKWTCPKCGDRCRDDTPNRFCTEGYRHSTREDGSYCGGEYEGDLFGFMLVAGVR